MATSGELTADNLATVEDKLQSLAAMVSVASVHSTGSALLALVFPLFTTAVYCSRCVVPVSSGKVQETVECVTRSLALLSQSTTASEDVLHAGVDTLSKLLHE